MTDRKKAAKAIFEQHKLNVSQQTGVVRDGVGNVVGRQQWIVGCNYSFDGSEEIIVNAASQEEAAQKAEEIISRKAIRAKMELGPFHTEFSMPKGDF